MAVFRSFAPAFLAAALAVAAGSAALADPPPWAHGHGHGGEQGDQGPPMGAPHSHAVVSGVIAGVDYGAAVILVATPHGVVPVAVTPTTSIIRGSSYASLADLGRGARVSADVSDIDGRLIAQIIRIR